MFGTTTSSPGPGVYTILKLYVCRRSKIHWIRGGILELAFEIGSIKVCGHFKLENLGRTKNR